MAFTIHETPVHWEEVAPPTCLPHWAGVVWVSIPGYSRGLWFLSKTGHGWQQRQRDEIVRRAREILTAAREAEPETGALAG